MLWRFKVRGFKDRKEKQRHTHSSTHPHPITRSCSDFYVFSHFILTTPQHGHNWYSHFSEELTEVQRGNAIATAQLVSGGARFAPGSLLPESIFTCSMPCLSIERHSFTPSSRYHSSATCIAYLYLPIPIIKQMSTSPIDPLLTFLLSFIAASESAYPHPTILTNSACSNETHSSKYPLKT